jgi:hypothetical protein
VFFRVLPWPIAGLQRRYPLSKCHSYLTPVFDPRFSDKAKGTLMIA